LTVKADQPKKIALKTLNLTSGFSKKRADDDPRGLFSKKNNKSAAAIANNMTKTKGTIELNKNKVPLRRLNEST